MSTKTVNLTVNNDGQTIKQNGQNQLYVDSNNVQNIPQANVTGLVTKLSEIDTSLGNKQNKIVDAVNGNLAGVNSSGQTTDSGFSVVTNLTNPSNATLPTTQTVVTGNQNVLTQAAQDATTKANTAEANAISTSNTYTDNQCADTLQSANLYTDELVDSQSTQDRAYTDQSCASTLQVSKDYTDQVASQTLISAAQDATTKANTAEANAISYTDTQLEGYQTLIASANVNNFVISDSNGQTVMSNISKSLLESFNGTNQIVKLNGKALDSTITVSAEQAFIQSPFAAQSGAITAGDSVQVAIQKNLYNINLNASNLSDFETATTANLANKVNKIVNGTLNNFITVGASGAILDSGLSFSTDPLFQDASNANIYSGLATKTFINFGLATKMNLRVPSTVNSLGILDSSGQIQSSNITLSSDTTLSGGNTTVSYSGTVKSYVDNANLSKLNIISGGQSGQIIVQNGNQVATSGKIFVNSITPGGMTNDQIVGAAGIDNRITESSDALTVLINTKASQTSLDNAVTTLNASIDLKANITYVDTQLALKADITYVDTQDQVLQDAIDLKASEAYVNSTFIPLSQKGVANGVAPIGSNGLIPQQYLPLGPETPLGAWNASTNTPFVQDGVGNAGDFYDVTVAGTQTFGGVSYDFLPGDYLACNVDKIWYKAVNTNIVYSVNGQVGPVVLTSDDISLTSPFTANNATINSNQTIQEALQNTQGQLNNRLDKITVGEVQEIVIIANDGQVGSSGQTIDDLRFEILTQANENLTTAIADVNQTITDEIATVQPKVLSAVGGNIATFSNGTTVDSGKKFVNTINELTGNNDIVVGATLYQKFTSLVINDINGFFVNNPTSRQFLIYNSVSEEFENGSLQTQDLPNEIDAAKIGDGTVSNTEFQYLNNLTGNIQTQLDGKVNKTGAASANTLILSDGNGGINSSSYNISNSATLSGGSNGFSADFFIKGYVDTGLDGRYAKQTLTNNRVLLAGGTNGDTITQASFLASQVALLTTGDVLTGYNGSLLTGLTKAQVGLASVQNVDTTNLANVNLLGINIVNTAIAVNDTGEVIAGKTQGQINALGVSLAGIAGTVNTLNTDNITNKANIATNTANIQTNTTNITALQTGKISTELNNGQILIGNGSNVATAVSVTGDVSISNTGVTSISASTVTDKALTGFSVGANTAIVASDKILGAFGKTQGQINALSISVGTNSSNITALQNDKLDTSAFTDSAVTGKLLTLFSATNAVIVDTDSILEGFNKAQGQINAINTNIETLQTDKLDTSAFTDSAVTGKFLTGLSTATSSIVLPDDSILQGVGKLQGQVNTINSTLSGGVVTGYELTADKEDQIVLVGNINNQVYASPINIGSIVTYDNTSTGNSVTAKTYLNAMQVLNGFGINPLSYISSPHHIVYTGSGVNNAIKLPNANDLSRYARGGNQFNTPVYTIDNRNSSNDLLDVINGNSIVIAQIPANKRYQFMLMDNSTVAGVWAIAETGTLLNVANVNKRYELVDGNWIAIQS